jgi:tricorn protease interacting factor F2/3
MVESYVPPKVREYRVDLDVRHGPMTFSGTVEVRLDSAVRALRLNAVRLEVGCPKPGAVVEPHPELEEVWVTLPEPSETFVVSFSGRAAEKGLLGLYRSRYGPGHILTTQCEATGARQLYPCLDRPDRKAVLALRLTIDDGLQAIFNTPALSERPSASGGRHTIEFEPTPPMSTYLTFLAVGRFDWHVGPAGRVRVAVAAPPGRAGAGAYSAERAAEILPALERYYGIPYPLPKLDLVAVPEFAFGAMENWGAISFREMRLLVDEGTDARQKQQTLFTIAHELAHQWFGNLVTMYWWTDIWLNESFATFVEASVCDELYPQAGAFSDFLAEQFTGALAGDSLPSTHPVSVVVQRPEEIGQIFDEISYGKGASVLRMVESFIGPAAFREGVRRYLKEHAYSNASSDDLWRALEAAAGRPLTPLLSAWLSRPGHPLVRARLEAGDLKLTQERFALDGRHAPETWPIPLAIARAGKVEHRLFEGRTDRLAAGTDGPIHLNPSALGFYRVLYDPALYERLRRAFPTLPASDRWVVLQDLLAFLLAGEVDRARYFEFLDASADASELLVVLELASQLSSTSPGRPPTALGALLGTDPEFRRHATGFLSAQIGRIGLEPRAGAPDDQAILRERVAASLVPLDEGFARDLAGRLGDYRTLPPELRWPVALASAHTGEAWEFETLLDLLKSAPDEGDAHRLERALARFRDAKLVERALSLALTPTVNRAHVSAMLREAGLNPMGRAATWAWVRTRLHDAAPDYEGTPVVGDILQFTVPYVGLGRAAEVRAELQARPFPGAERGASKGLYLLGVYERLMGRRG